MNNIAREGFCRLMLSILLLLSVSCANAQDYHDQYYPDFVGYVNDYAHLLSAPQASSLNQELRDFDNRTTIELAVVTVNSIGDESPESYAANLANLWGIGKRDNNNGIIFLVAMESHDIWIEIGRGLSGEISDRQVQRIVDDIIIPQFRAGRADQGIIEGTRALIDHFDGSAPLPVIPTPAAPEKTASSAQSQGREDRSLFIWIVSALAALIVLPGAFFGIINPRLAQAKKNKAKLEEIRKDLDGMIGSSTAAIEALKELKANYVPSVWKSAEDGFSIVDLDKLELDYIAAWKESNRGWTNAPAAQQLISDLENSAKIARKNVSLPTERLVQVKKAKVEYQSRLAGLDLAFKQAENEIAGAQISMSTIMDLEKAKQLYREAKDMAEESPDTIDWIVLQDRIQMAEEAVRQVSQNAARDKAIAAKIQGQDPEEMLAKIKDTLEAGERELGGSYSARPDLEASRAEYERARGYRSGDINAIDLYIILNSVDRHVEHGRRSRQREMEIGRQRAEKMKAQERATSVRHSGFGSSGSDGFGGGRMGGGSSGGGKW